MAKKPAYGGCGTRRETWWTKNVTDNRVGGVKKLNKNFIKK
jgi:hypothetical protein